MTSFALVGFVADLYGNEDHLLQVEGVVEVSGERFVVPAGHWDESDLERISESDEAYIHRLPLRESRTIPVGSTVWLAGSNFVSDISRLPLREASRAIGAWSLIGNARWTVGTPQRFGEFAQQIAQQAQFLLQQYLFDPLEKSHGDAQLVQRLYEVLPISRSRQRDSVIGLFFHETRDDRAFRLFAADTVAFGVFENESEFEDAVEAKAASLRQRRLSEGAQTRPEIELGDLERFGVFEHFDPSWFTRFMVRRANDRVIDAS